MLTIIGVSDPTAVIVNSGDKCKHRFINAYLQGVRVVIYNSQPAYSPGDKDSSQPR